MKKEDKRKIQAKILAKHFSKIGLQRAVKANPKDADLYKEALKIKERKKR